MAEENEKAPEVKPGIVVTDADGKGGQGFIPAEVAEAAGVRVTGTTETEREPADTEDADTPKAARKTAAKVSRKK